MDWKSSFCVVVRGIQKEERIVSEKGAKIYFLPKNMKKKIEENSTRIRLDGLPRGISDS